MKAHDSGSSRKWLGGVVLVALAAARCGSSSSTPSTTAAQPAPGASRARADFGSHLGLAVSLQNAPAVGDKSATVNFALTNNGSGAFDGCFGQAWGVSLIVAEGHDAGHIVRADYPKCEEKVSLLPLQTIVWSKKVPLGRLSAGPAKLTGWVRIVDPAACDPSRGCRDVSIASTLQKITIGAR